MAQASREFQVLVKPIGPVCNLDCGYCYYLRKRDLYRVTRGGKPTHKHVMQSFRLLQRYRIPCDILCVVHRENVRHPAAVYRFVKEMGADYLQFLPLVARQDDHGVRAETVPAEAYGAFLCTVFHEWVRHDVGRIGIQNFDEAMRPFLGMDHALCLFRQTCGDVVVVEHNGDFYSCDHFVDRAHRLGNIRDTPLAEMLESTAQREFGRRKWDSLPRYCRECEVLALCNGGCPKDRFARTPEGEDGLNYLYAGFKQFFIHTRPYLRRLASFRRSGRPAEEFMREVRSEDAQVSREAGRNDPCPCGSGKKYKKCCLGKSLS